MCICQLTASSWNVAKLTVAFGVSNTVVGDSERRCQRHKDGPPPHTLKQHEHQHEPALAASPAADQFQTRQTLLSGDLFSTARLPC